MIVLGANSDISQAFIEVYLEKQNKTEVIYLVSSNPEEAEKLAKHLNIKYGQNIIVIAFDLIKDTDYSVFDGLNYDLIFCATGYLGQNTEEGLMNFENTDKIIEINYSKLVPLINHLIKPFIERQNGSLIALSSVAGERGRQSNFIYGSAKAGWTAYLSGLRNYLYPKNIHVLTVLPGFMDTKMTADIETPKPLTSSPKSAGNQIYNAFKKKKNITYVSKIWYPIMMIIKNIPEPIFKKLKL